MQDIFPAFDQVRHFLFDLSPFFLKITLPRAMNENNN